MAIIIAITTMEATTAIVGMADTGTAAITGTKQRPRKCVAFLFPALPLRSEDVFQQIRPKDLAMDTAGRNAGGHQALPLLLHETRRAAEIDIGVR